MVSVSVSAAVIATLSLQSVPASSLPPLVPSGPWRVEYADAMCIVGRTFATGDQETILGFRPGPMSEHFRVAVYVPDKSKKVTRGIAELIFDDLAPISAPFLRGPISIEGMNIIQIDTKRSEITALNSAKILHVRAGELSRTLALRNIAGAMKALDACEKDLLVDWGMDPSILANIKTYAVHKSIVSLFSVNDYPSEAISRNHQGTAGVRFKIGTDGKVSDCRIAETSGSDILDRRTCEIITKRARYEPSRTKSGEPVPSIGFQRIRWELPK